MKHLERFFGQVISLYSKEQAIEDGVLFEAPDKHRNKGVVFTTSLIGKLEKEEIICALLKGLKEAAKFTRPDLEEFRIAGKKIWVDDNGQDLTFMLPEDY